ncbi:MAG: RNA methyltransferase [Candidatus Hadarchaeales archaeon]
MRFRVLLPASLVCDVSDLRQKTLKIGIVGRALAIFRVDSVWIYDDHEPKVKNPQEEMNLIKLILEYMETPQYLRKILFRKKEELKFAGMLPPLRTPHHPSVHERSSRQQIREGAVISSKGGKSIVELGLPKRGLLSEEVKPGTRITVRILKDIGDYLIVEEVRKEEVKDYWGYRVYTAPSLSEAVRMSRSGFMIGTSKHGRNLEDVMHLLKSVRDPLTVAFGGPYAGLFEICAREGVKTEDLFDMVINMVPGQGTETVRTEEALIASLAILNVLRSI